MRAWERAALSALLIVCLIAATAASAPDSTELTSDAFLVEDAEDTSAPVSTNGAAVDDVADTNAPADVNGTGDEVVAGGDNSAKESASSTTDTGASLAVDDAESASTAIEGISAAESAPIILIDAESGHWLYQSATLRVEITRRTFDDPLVWYEVDLQTSPTAALRGVLSAEKRPQQHLKSPDVIAREHQLVYAQTDDFYADRIGSSKRKTGVVIRGGKTLYNSVYSGNAKAFPPLDTMALFPDGRLGVFRMREYSADQYLALGATDVFSFGPILIRGGEMDARLEKGYADKEPRSTVGMIAPYHYFSIIVEGRHAGSVGCGLKRIAQRMLEVGVTEALNLDGGQTAALVFLGEKLNTTGSYSGRARIRSVGGMLGVGDGLWKMEDEQ